MLTELNAIIYLADCFMIFWMLHLCVSGCFLFTGEENVSPILETAVTF